MPLRRQFLLAATALLAASCSSRAQAPFPVTHSDADWHRLLTPDQYAVLRQAGTEPPWTSPLLKEHRAGRFACAGCNTAAFDASTKFESGTGWPSFTQPLPHAVRENRDYSMGMERTEIVCATCGGHLGHVFDDGPAPTGLRYCMNGIALNFHASQEG